MQQQDIQTQQQNYSFELSLPQKLIVVGNSGIGKSCILNQYINKTFQEKTNTTIGHDFLKKVIVVNDTAVVFLIWDTAGQEKFRPIIKSYFKGSKAAFIVFSVIDGKSFEDIRYWGKELDRGVDTVNFPKILLANKCDYEEENWQVTKDKIENSVKKEKFDSVFYTSAKTGQNINEAFQEMGRLIIEQNKDLIQEVDNGNSNNKNQNQSDSKKISSKKKSDGKKSGGCC